MQVAPASGAFYILDTTANSNSQNELYNGISDIHIPPIPDDKETFYRVNDDAKGYLRDCQWRHR